MRDRTAQLVGPGEGPPLTVGRDRSGAAERLLDPLPAAHQAALAGAVAEVARDWPEAGRAKAAAVLDVPWNLPAYERLMTAWNLEATRATQALTWAISVVTGAIRSGGRPGGTEANGVTASGDPPGDTGQGSAADNVEV